MKIKAFLFDDDRGFSPVIGVILMVAITVILAAVIAAFVLGLGDTNESAPSVTWDYDYDSSIDGEGTLTITMTGGESFDPARVSFAGDNLGSTGTFDNSSDGTEDLSDVTATTERSWEDIVGITGNSNVDSEDFGDDVGTITAGNSIVLGLAADNSGSGNDFGTIDTDFELRIIFESEDGGTSSEIGGTTGSDA